MKYQYLSFSLLLASFLCSCEDQDIVVDNTPEKTTPKEIVYNITVNAPEVYNSSDTRAKKKGWVEGDRILLWFDQQPTRDTSCAPNQILEFSKDNEGKKMFWKPTIEVEDLGITLNPSGKVWAFYEGENDGAPFTYRSIFVPDNDGCAAQEIKAIPMIAYAWENDYTYDESTDALSADLHWFTRADYIAEAETVGYNLMQLPATSGARNLMGVGFTNFQIVITGLNKASGKYGNYALKCDNFNNFIQPYPGGIDTEINRYTLSIENADGPAFYFKHDSQYYTVFEFTLIDLNGTTPEFYTYTSTDQRWDSRYEFFTGITIPFSKFKKADYHKHHQYVDLGLKTSDNKPIYWATTNVNAYNLLDCASSFFAWGETANRSTDFDESHYSVTAFADAATTNWGGNWRTPTKAELQQLIDGCNWQLVTFVGADGDTRNKAYKISNKTDASKYIYLPIGGYNDFDENNTFIWGLKYGEIENYWASDLDGADNGKAYSLEITSDPEGKEMKTIERYLGRTIRAVYVP